MNPLIGRIIIWLITVDQKGIILVATVLKNGERFRAGLVDTLFPMKD